MEEQENKNEQEETQKEPENSSTLEDPAEAHPEKQAEQPEEKTEDIQAGNVQPDNLQQEEQQNPQPEKQAEKEPHILEVPLFSEETADFLMRSQHPEDAKLFLEGKEYSLYYLSRKFIFSSWDNYCDNFSRLILPVIFFAAADSFPLVLLIFSSNLIFPALFSIFFLAPLQISKNLFYIHLISGVKKPFHNSLKVFSKFKYYLNSLFIVCLFVFSLFCGISLMILPGYMFYVLFAFSVYFAADEKLSIMAAFKLSFVGTRGYRIFIGSIFLFNLMLQSLIPGIFSIGISGDEFKAGFVAQPWNLAGFFIFTLVISPIIQMIMAGIYLEVKQSIYNTAYRVLSRFGKDFIEIRQNDDKQDKDE